MAYNQKPETPLVNNGEFGDKIEKVSTKPAQKIEVESKEPELRTLPKEDRKWSEEKDKDSTVKQHGPKRIHNPDKKIEMGEGYKERHGLPLDKDHFISKEEYVRKGLRKTDNKLVAGDWAKTTLVGGTATMIAKHLNK